MAIESFSAKANLARVGAGFKGGNFFSNPITPPKMTFVEGWPSESNEKSGQQPIKQGTPIDVWNERRSSGK